MEFGQILSALNVPAVIVHKSGETNVEILHTTKALMDYYDCDYSSHDEAQRIPYDFLSSKKNFWIPIGGRNAIVVPAEFGNVLKLWFESNKDHLTETFNRRGLESAYSRLRSRVGSEGVLMVLYLDANKFKPVNDRYGHEVGDRILRAMCKRLQGQLKATDIVARVGGDEFAALVWVPNTDLAVEFENGRLKFIQEYVCRQPYSIDGRKDLPTGFALGLHTHLGELPEDVYVLLKKAEIGMYANKAISR